MKNCGLEAKPPGGLDTDYNYVLPGRKFDKKSKEQIDYFKGSDSLIEYLKQHEVIREPLPPTKHRYVKMEHCFWESKEKAATFCESVANETLAYTTDSSDNTTSKHPRSARSDQSACEKKGKRLRAATNYGPQGLGRNN